jgi:hypothetical protein
MRRTDRAGIGQKCVKDVYNCASLGWTNNMPLDTQEYVPGMSDAAVKAKTGKDWAGWFGALDKAGAAKLTHPQIARLVHEKHGVPGWWSQMVTVEYELARGLRVRHQTATGFSVSASKTIATTLPSLYAATANAAKRKQWFPKGELEPSSQTRNKYFRGSWNGGARLEIGFYAKEGGKAQIAVQVNKLAKRTEVDRERAAWKAALVKLERMLSG